MTSVECSDCLSVSQLVPNDAPWQSVAHTCIILCVSFTKYNVYKAKKKKLCLKACENFSNRRGMRFFIFYFIFFYFNWPLPPRTSETKNDWKVSTSVFSEIKRDFTRFLSSHVLKFFQNSKLSSFFVVKKKNISRKKKWKSEFCKIKCAQKNKCGRQLWDTEFFFFSLKSAFPKIGKFFLVMVLVVIGWIYRRPIQISWNNIVSSNSICEVLNAKNRFLVWELVYGNNVMNSFQSNFVTACQL